MEVKVEKVALAEKVTEVRVVLEGLEETALVMASIFCQL